MRAVRSAALACADIAINNVLVSIPNTAVFQAPIHNYTPLAADG